MTLTNTLIARVAWTKSSSTSSGTGLWAHEWERERGVRTAHSCLAMLVHAFTKPIAPAVTEHRESIPKSSHDRVKAFTRHMKYCCTGTEILRYAASATTPVSQSACRNSQRHEDTNRGGRSPELREESRVIPKVLHAEEPERVEREADLQCTHREQHGHHRPAACRQLAPGDRGKVLTGSAIGHSCGS